MRERVNVTTPAIQIDCHAGGFAGSRPIEIVERKGLGHPDTICDRLSEKFSVALSKYYLEHFGLVLHHNVDKALIAAGRSEPAFGAGRIVEPFDLFLAGRATAQVHGERIPIRELAHDAVSAWFATHMHACDVASGLRLNCITREGSSDLVDLFKRQRDAGRYLANDTSCGVGFAPLTDLERLVLAVETALNTPDFKQQSPETGEDIKVMGVREHDAIKLTVSCAFIGRYLENLAAYRIAKDRLHDAVLRIARTITSRAVDVRINAADGDTEQSIYLTVSGTSAEIGDDGETGRGNRINGLITPCRPMTLEAAAGKNPITHVGKLYNAAANRLAQALVAEVPGLREAECYLVSQIGSPIDEPRSVYLRVQHEDGGLGSDLQAHVHAIAAREIAHIPELWKAFLNEELPVA